MKLVLDAGALIGIERGARDLVAVIKQARDAQRPPTTHGGIVGQVWRGGHGRQARLARLLPGVRIEPLDDALGRRAGVLLGRARMTDVIDAAVVLLAADGDMILTSDPEDLRVLAIAAGIDVDIVQV